jgi:V/A-type H+-transporting ATPase subunit F
VNIAVVGTEDFTLGFKMVGVRTTFEVKEDSPTLASELEDCVNRAMRDPEVGILVMHGDHFALLDARLKRRVLDSIRPVFVPIGEVEDETLRERIKQAVGVDLWV